MNDGMTGDELDETSGKASQLDSKLQRLAAAYEEALAIGPEDEAAAHAARTAGSGAPIVGEYVVIDVIADSGMASKVLAALESLGLEHGAEYGRVVSGLMPISALAELEGVEGIALASASLSALSVGQVTSQGDPAMDSDDARAEFGVDGTGVSIGVLSDSFNNEDGLVDDVASGDLPSGIQILQDLSPNSGQFPGSDEGRGMAQLIHDVAPGAEILFHTAFLGQANFAQGILDLAEAGAELIVDDVFYFAEPMFADGIIAQAVDAVVAAGATYFSSAGNSSRDSYEAAYRAVSVNPDSITTDGTFTDNPNSTFHDFDPGPGVDLTLNYTLDDGDTFQLSFQWDQPYASTSAASPGSASDYDIWLINAATGEVLDFSLSNSAGADPIEALSFENDTGSNLEVALVIEKWDDLGPDAGLIKIINFGGQELIETSAETAGSTSFGHSNAAGAISVAASAWFNTPAFGDDPAIVNGFSSEGGVPILFDQSGQRLDEPIVRERPTLTGPDGGNTTFFGSDSGADPDSFPNFFGTSASAPHVAAVAALMLEINPSLSPEQIREILEDTARDMDDPATPGFDDGFDFRTGYGFIDARAAVAAAAGVTGEDPEVPLIEDPDSVIAGTEGEDNLFGGPGNELIEGFAGDDRLNGVGGSDTLEGGDGRDVLLGGEGDDFLDGEAGDDVLRGGGGNDVLTDLGGANLLDGGAGNDLVTSGDGDDFLIGRGGQDVLDGGAGRDSLRGQEDADTLIGGTGRDILIGAEDGDAYVYQSVEDSLADPAARDTILAFRGAAGDSIDLSAIDAVAGTETNDIFTVVESFSGTAGELVFFQSQNGDIWRVRGDVDGDGAADLEILVEAPLGLSESDFAL